jgi:phospholipase/lecithinase/hemolysin
MQKIAQSFFFILLRRLFMRHFKYLAVSLGSALLVAACGGGGTGDQSPKIKFTSVVSFGDSLSDAGTYNVGAVKALGGGIFSVNGISGGVGTNPVPSYTWAQLVAAAAVGSPSCPARVGGFGQAPSNASAMGASKCRNYAQGGARITDPRGVGNPVGAGFTQGALTQPVVTQIANFSSDNGSANFSGGELVTVLAGANDLFAQSDKLKADAAVAGGNALASSLVSQLLAGVPAVNQASAQAAIGSAVQAAAGASGSTPASIISAAITAAATHAAMNGYTNSANPVANANAIGATAGAAALAAGNAYAATTGAQVAVAGMATAATTLAGYVKDMVNRGAKYVAVVNIPDVSQTPMAGKTPSSKPLVLAMTTAFNTTLQSVLAGTPGVLFVDAFAENQRQFLSPSQYGLTNVTDVACNLFAPANALDLTKDGSGSSLVCNTSNLVPGDTSRFLFADGVHPTPYGHKLLAQYVTDSMAKAGWL